jgi:hypothetical protein
MTKPFVVVEAAKARQGDELWGPSLQANLSDRHEQLPSAGFKKDRPKPNGLFRRKRRESGRQQDK